MWSWPRGLFARPDYGGQLPGGRVNDILKGVYPNVIFTIGNLGTFQIR